MHLGTCRIAGVVEFCIYMNTLVITHADCTCALPLVDEDIMHLFMYLTFEDQDSLSTIKSHVSDVENACEDLC